MDITSAELLEWSIVPVPANAEALMGRAAKALGLSTSAFKARFVRGVERGDTSSPFAHDFKSVLKRVSDQASRIERRLGIGTPNATRDVTQEEVDLVVNALIDVGLSEDSPEPINITSEQLDQVIQDSLDRAFGIDSTRKRSETDLQWAFRTHGGATLKVR